MAGGNAPARYTREGNWRLSFSVSQAVVSINADKSCSTRLRIGREPGDDLLAIRHPPSVELSSGLQNLRRLSDLLLLKYTLL